MATAAKRGPLIYLREGHVSAMMLPLSPDIEKRWRNGHLTRVHPDSSPWQDSDGDPFAVLPGPADDGDNGTPDTTDPADGEHHPAGDQSQPARPRGNAPRRNWAAYAVALGMVGEAEAAVMTRDELREMCTPPEMRPPDPDQM